MRKTDVPRKKVKKKKRLPARLPSWAAAVTANRKGGQKFNPVATPETKNRSDGQDPAFEPTAPHRRAGVPRTEEAVEDEQDRKGDIRRADEEASLPRFLEERLVDPPGQEGEAQIPQEPAHEEQ
jgi:hypothetical protein